MVQARVCRPTPQNQPKSTEITLLYHLTSSASNQGKTTFIQHREYVINAYLYSIEPIHGSPRCHVATLYVLEFLPLHRNPSLKKVGKILKNGLTAKHSTTLVEDGYVISRPLASDFNDNGISAGLGV